MYVLVKKIKINNIGGLGLWFFVVGIFFFFCSSISAFKQMLLPWTELLVDEIWLPCLRDKATMESLEMLSVFGIKTRKNIPDSLFIQLLSSRRKT